MENDIQFEKSGNEINNQQMVFELSVFTRLFIYYLIISFFILLISGANSEGGALFFFDLFFSGAFIIFSIIALLVVFIKKKANGIDYISFSKIVLRWILISQLVMYVSNFLYAIYDTSFILWIVTLFLRISFAVLISMFWFSSHSIERDKIEQKEFENLKNPKMKVWRKIIEFFLFAVSFGIVTLISPEISGLGTYGTYIFCVIFFVIIFIFLKFYRFVNHKLSGGISILIAATLASIFLAFSYVVINSKKESLDYLYKKNIMNDIHDDNLPYSSVIESDVSI